MTFNISKTSRKCSNVSGLSANSVFSYGQYAIGFSGSGYFVNMYNNENGNATEPSTILLSDISEQI